MEFTESQVIAELAQVFAQTDKRVLVGIGDDAAVLAPSSQNSVITTDMAVEGVHFRQEWSSSYEIGRKITAANLADLYAMGASPRHLVVSVCLSGKESMQWIIQLAQGMRDEAQKCNASIVGGDIVRGPVVTISMTAVGEVDAPILRSGAKVGDAVYLSSLPGWSAAGLHLLSNAINISALTSNMEVERALNQFRAPDVGYADSLAFSEAHSMCDISDGLTEQGRQIAQASGVKLELDSTLIQNSDEFALLSKLAKEVSADVWDWIGAGGEDHVFLATGVNLPGLRIGSVLEGEGINFVGLAKFPKSFTHFS